jgi:hypothetical protein
MQAKAMMERELQDHIVELATKGLGLLCYHTHDSRHSPKGFPDLIILGRGRMVVSELKRQREKPTPDQEKWLREYRQLAEEFVAPAGGKGCPPVEVYVWRPMDWLDGSIRRILTGDFPVRKYARSTV